MSSAVKPDDMILGKPMGVCAICQKPVMVSSDRAQVTIRTFRAGKLSGASLLLNACGSAHLAEALHRFAKKVEDKLPSPDPGSTDWAHKHGIVVEGPND